MVPGVARTSAPIVGMIGVCTASMRVGAWKDRVMRTCYVQNNTQETTMIRRVMISLVASLALAAQAQGYPNKPIKLMVGFEAGGNTDVVARVVAQKLSERLGQQIV